MSAELELKANKIVAFSTQNFEISFGPEGEVCVVDKARNELIKSWKLKPIDRLTVELLAEIFSLIESRNGKKRNYKPRRRVKRYEDRGI